jgi:hypothetical protein
MPGVLGAVQILALSSAATFYPSVGWMFPSLQYDYSSLNLSLGSLHLTFLLQMGPSSHCYCLFIRSLF